MHPVPIRYRTVQKTVIAYNSIAGEGCDSVAWPQSSIVLWDIMEAGDPEMCFHCEAGEKLPLAVIWLNRNYRYSVLSDRCEGACDLQSKRDRK